MQRTVRLIRAALDDDAQGTFGGLFLDGALLGHTIELPWRENARQVSCIPTGTYRVRWSRSPRLRRFTYEILDVPGRDGIRVHEGNFAGDKAAGFDSHSLGCPLVGQRAGHLKNRAGQWQRAVLLSAVTLRRIEDRLDRRDFVLEVSHAHP
ncbi:MAG: DUF5675 family protein [Burkholderiaceae bacterium]|jgi:hypothetical protein|nr:DUF5675 family protein [Burkholderiaceae bacterium]